MEDSDQMFPASLSIRRVVNNSAASRPKPIHYFGARCGGRQRA
jgi:hypothetical protein